MPRWVNRTRKGTATVIRPRAETPGSGGGGYGRLAFGRSMDRMTTQPPLLRWSLMCLLRRKPTFDKCKALRPATVSFSSLLYTHKMHALASMNKNHSRRGRRGRSCLEPLLLCTGRPSTGTVCTKPGPRSARRGARSRESREEEHRARAKSRPAPPPEIRFASAPDLRAIQAPKGKRRESLELEFRKRERVCFFLSLSFSSRLRSPRPGRGNDAKQLSKRSKQMRVLGVRPLSRQNEKIHGSGACCCCDGVSAFSMFRHVRELC